MQHDLFGIGLNGKSLTPLERKILHDSSPYGVVLFGRNIGDADQLRSLIAEIKSTAKTPPLIMMDQEGGRVDRLRHLIPGIPSAEALGEGEKPHEMAAWFGRVIGMALRFFDIEVDLAPVVDFTNGASPKGLERRTFGHDVETVVDLAGAFMRGLHSAGTASCLKHFPGIGGGSADPHYGATVIDVPLDELRKRELVPYVRLAREAGAVMIGHGIYPQIDSAELPATLSRKLTFELLRNVAGFDGLAISDDMEMHAVSDLGSYESIAERALLAGNDVILFCSHIERVPDLQRHLARRVDEDEEVQRCFSEAAKRCDRYREHVAKIRREASPPIPTFDDLKDEAARFIDEFQRTRRESKEEIAEGDRRKQSRTEGKGHTGREEWT